MLIEFVDTPSSPPGPAAAAANLPSLQNFFCFSEVWKHFITTTDDKRWTAGKRKAEADPLVGVNFLTTLQAPGILPDTELAIDEKICQFGREIVKTDAAVKVLADVAETEVTRLSC